MTTDLKKQAISSIRDTINKNIPNTTDKDADKGGNASVLNNSLAGAFYLIGLQMSSRLFTFILNTLMVTAVDTTVLGVFSIKYQLLASLILFLSREAIRRTCIRVVLNDNNMLQRLINLSWMVIPTGLLLSLGMQTLFTQYSTPEELAIEHYQLGLYLFTLASFLELLSEPVYILTQNMLLFKVRTYVEGSALFLKAVATFYYVVIKNDGLKGFGYAQIIYSLTLLFGYYGNFILNIYGYGEKPKDDKQIKIKSLNQLLPKSIKNDNFISKDLIKLTGLYTWQSVQKLLLTEGEKFVLYFSESLTSQAIFSVVSNLGSLIARFFFQPIEESCFSMFPKLFGESSRRQDWVDGSKVLAMLMKLMFIIAMIFSVFGPAYSELLLNVLYRNKFANSNASTILGVYCLYVGFMAINGVSEAFVHSVSKADQLKTLNWILIVIGAIYLAATYILSFLLGTTGIILANCINMFLRILYSIYFMSKFFKDIKEFSIKSMFPEKKVMILFIGSYVMTTLSNRYFGGNQSSLFAISTIIHIGVGASCFLAVMFSLYKTEISTFREIKKVLKSSKQQ